jgi:hypothetical protein
MNVLRSRGVSPSALDSFSRCPFQFFAERLLELGDSEDAEERGLLSSSQKGRIYHLALQRFHEKLKAAGFWDKPAGTPWEPHLKEACADVFTAAEGKALGVYPLLWESARREMTGRLARLAAWDIGEIRAGGYIPESVEATLAAQVLSGETEIRFYGQPDRIDRNPQTRLFRVIDYKTRKGNTKSLRSRVLNMKVHQPVLYLEMAQQSAKGYEADSARYCYLESPGDDEPVEIFTAADWRECREGFLENVAAFLGQMDRGGFLIAPEENPGGVCARCPFPALCRKSHGASRRRAEDSRLRAAFDAAHRVEVS